MMEFKDLGELQDHLLNSDYRDGHFLESLYTNISGTVPSMESEQQAKDYMQLLGETFVLADYIQTYYTKKLAIGKHPTQDNAYLAFLSKIQSHLYELAVESIASYPNQQGKLQEMIDQPEKYYTEVKACKHVEPTLDSLHRFRLEYPVPFDEAHPENLRHLYRLYQKVAKINEDDLKREGWSEWVQWLNWAADGFTPLSYDNHVKAAVSTKKESIDQMDLIGSALQQLLPTADQISQTMSHLPLEAQDALINCIQAVDQLERNISRYFREHDSFGYHIPSQDPKQRQGEIKKQIKWLGEPDRQQSLFSSPPLPSENDRGVWDFTRDRGVNRDR